MDKIRKAFGLVGATIIASAAAATIGAGNSSAHIVDEWDLVKEVVCADASANPVTVEWTNKYGGTKKETGNLVGKTKVPNWNCASWEFNVPESFGGLSVSIETDEPGKIYCALWVNGQLVSESEDQGEYGSYTYCI